MVGFKKKIEAGLSAPCANPVFFRTYSRRDGDDGYSRESEEQVHDRTLNGIRKVGKLTDAEFELLNEMQRSKKMLPSGRWLWAGGTPWSENQRNLYGLFNCSYNEIYDWRSFGLQMELGMTGCGTGASMEHRCVDQLPPILNKINVQVIGEFGDVPKEDRSELTTLIGGFDSDHHLVVGDSRDGWVQSFEHFLELAADESLNREINLTVDISNIRPEGEKLKGFGGVANPRLLKDLYPELAKITNRAVGRKLTPEEVCLLIDTAARVVVAGSIRRFAGIKLFDADTPVLKLGLWKEVDGVWQIDPDRDALRMSNHTRVFKKKPTLEQLIDAVRIQHSSGEGAIMWAGEAVARANADLLADEEKKQYFISLYEKNKTEAMGYLENLASRHYPISKEELRHRINRHGLNPCAEIVGGAGFQCNLAEVNLNLIDPLDFEEQEKALKAAAISVASLLHLKFKDARVQQSREWDPIVAVCLTGMFDFFVQAFGVDWLKWWEVGRPDTVQGLEFKSKEQEYLTKWKKIVRDAVWEYCDRHGLKRPNRYTAIQPSGSKSLLTGASPGWHPPKAQRFIRRITFRKNDPVALACLDYGYKIVPSQSDKDENGRLLDDPFDPRCTEWLVEIPVEVPWANLPGADQIDISQFSALAQMDFAMQVQKHYVTHNLSSTIELREHEIEPLAERIYQAIQDDEGYISAALLARFDDKQTFPRLPFEPISKDVYDQLVQSVLQRRTTDDFHAALARHDSGDLIEAGPAGCESDRCLFPVEKEK